MFKAGIDDLLAETGGLPDAPEANHYSTLRTSAYVLWQPSRDWEFRAGARLDGMAQEGGRADLTRFVMDELPDRRRAQLAARWEQSLGEYKLDAVWLPVFRGAQLPDIASIWSPINRTTGQVLGIAPSPSWHSVKPLSTN